MPNAWQGDLPGQGSGAGRRSDDEVPSATAGRRLPGWTGQQSPRALGSVHLAYVRRV